MGTVRSSLGIISQDPILLGGTLRLNLDIYEKYSDEELYTALHHVQLLKRAPSDVESSGSSNATVVEEELEQVNIFTNLDSEIKSGGEKCVLLYLKDGVPELTPTVNDSLSAGQKQLIVLARALLQRHRCLLLDEATANIDSATDAEISRVVHEEFKGVTVLIIAHRLRASRKHPLDALRAKLTEHR